MGRSSGIPRCLHRPGTRRAAHFIAGINRSLSLPEVRSGHRAVDIIVSWGKVKEFYYGISEVIVVLRQAIIFPSSEEEIRIKRGL